VEIHKAQFLLPGTLLGRLSPTLIAALYATFLDRSIFLVHASDGEVDGFVLGGSSSAMMRCRLSFFRKHALFCIAEVTHQPQLWLRAFRSFVKLIKCWLSTRTAVSPREEFRMLSIAVAAHAARKGVGTELVQGFEATIGASCHMYSLNVLKTNTSAIRFYEQLAFQCVGETEIAWTLRKVLATNSLWTAGGTAGAEFQGMER
jgi:ribosomal protein S18 acetylase RimI-like enzyme